MSAEQNLFDSFAQDFASAKGGDALLFANLNKATGDRKIFLQALYVCYTAVNTLPESGATSAQVAAAQNAIHRQVRHAFTQFNAYQANPLAGQSMLELTEFANAGITGNTLTTLTNFMDKT
ncbi:hypothetical protein BG011_002224, partial [Mortierella polycephala]